MRTKENLKSLGNVKYTQEPLKKDRNYLLGELYFNKIRNYIFKNSNNIFGRAEKRVSASGITLVALVVTVVVLLILAGVTIGVILGENGLFNKVEDAVEKYSLEKVREQIENIRLDWYTKKQTEENVTVENFFVSLEKANIISSKEDNIEDLGQEDGNNVYIVYTNDGYSVEVIVDAKDNIEIGKIAKKTRDNTKVRRIRLNETSKTLQQNDTLQLTAIVTPETAINKTVTWESSNPSVATVNSNGLVTAVSVGNASITAKATDGSETTAMEPCLITVESLTLENIVGNPEEIEKDTVVYDKNENQVVIPAGFRVLAHGTESADIEKVEYKYDTVKHTPCVQDGIVIADKNNNQFVWIPVGTINDDTEGTTTTITLGRYSAWGQNPTLVESADTTILDAHEHLYELKELTGNSSRYTNAKAQNLQKFIDNANKDHGYWFGRYEASAETVNNINVARVKYNKTPWTGISQTDASARAVEFRTGQNSSGNYLSDLFNSYMWDTAIVFIERYASLDGNINYAYKGITGNVQNTGLSGDDFCNIHDMALNCREWTTETATHSIYTAPFASRGGQVNEEGPATRYAGHNYYTDFSFRIGLYSNE